MFKKLYCLLTSIAIRLENISDTLNRLEEQLNDIEKLVDLFYEQNTALLDDIEKTIVNKKNKV